MPESTPPPSSALRWMRVISAILLVAFCAVVAIITFWPGPPDPDGQQALREFLVRAHANGLPGWITFGKIEFGANILMFVPIGLFGALSLPRHRWLIIPAAFAASAAIEIVQHAGLPERVGSFRDVLANGLGATVGYLLSCVVIALVLRRGRSGPATTAMTDRTPTTPSPAGP